MITDKERDIQLYDMLRGMLTKDQDERLCAKDVDLLLKSREAEGKRKGIQIEYLNSEVKRSRGKGDFIGGGIIDFSLKQKPQNKLMLVVI